MKLGGLGIGRCTHGEGGERLSWWLVALLPTIKRGAVVSCRRCAGVADALITHNCGCWWSFYKRRVNSAVKFGQHKPHTGTPSARAQKAVVSTY